MIRVVSLKICPFVQRVTAALEARAIPYEVEYINLDAPPAWFADASPNAQVPLLITDSGTVLFESDAIVEYVDEVSPPLLEGISAETRALERAWSTLASKHYLVQCGAMRSADADAFQSRGTTLRDAFRRIERELGDSNFFRGESPGNVDIAWLPLLHRAHIVEQRTGYDYLEAFPKVKAWQQQLMSTGLAEKSVSSDFESVFSAFYLSDQTLLGQGKAPAFNVAQAGGTGSCGSCG